VSDLSKAHAAVTKAEQRVAEAEAALTAARGELDQHLANAGWRRIIGLPGDGGAAVYENAIYGSTVSRDQLLRHLLAEVAA
jgi:hypothetical protein